MREIAPHIEGTLFDLIVIGAGINGAGIARDAALRGLKALVLDKGDIAGGTTGWSTRLVHGGLRYLEHGELGLVRESLREREILLRVAPHLIKPLPLLIPIYERGRRGPLTIRMGMLAYDLLSFDKSLSSHHMLSAMGTLEHAPGLSVEGLKGAALYYDAQVEYPERLALENALDARAHGATLLTYARLEGLEVEEGRVRAAQFTDLLTNRAHTARARVFVNVAGPWVDEVLKKAAGGAGSQRLIGGTKGSHIVTGRFDGAPACALYVEAQADGRPFFIIPWNGLYLIGTTDTRYEEDLESVAASPYEVDYLLRETNRVIPRARLTRSSVLYTYSGVRPLPFLPDESASAAITRRHFVHDHAPGLRNLLSIVGGKITTYRNLSEQTVNMVLRKLDHPSAAASATASAPLPGAAASDFRSFAEGFRREHQELPDRVLDHLLRVYGTRASDVIRMACGDSGLLEPLDETTGTIGAEVLFSFREEMAQTLPDCLLRRTMTGLGPAATGAGVDERAASIARQYLGWDEARAQSEIDSYRDYIRRLHGVPIGPA